MQQAPQAICVETPDWPQILIVEDEVSIAKGLEMVLAEEGYTVDVAMTGRGALDSFNRKSFDLLVADLRLPDIDGMEVIREVKQYRPDTGVIIITGYSTVPSAVEAMKLGVADYLPKPFTEEEIVSAVKVVLDTKGLSRPASPDKTGIQPVEAPEPMTEDLLQVQTIMRQIRRTFSRSREALIPILQMVQNRMGFIPEAALEKIARFVRTPVASVYGVATFYEQFRLQPVGRCIVKVCRGTACHVKGAERILNEIETCYKLSPGCTSEDRSFTLETVACFGSCAIAPVVVVDDRVKGRMNPSKTRQAMEDIHGSDATR